MRASKPAGAHGLPEPATCHSSILQAPAQPKTPYGQMLQYYLKMEPALFKTAVEDQLARLRDDKEAKEREKEAQKDVQPNTSSVDLTLSKYVIVVSA